MGETQITASRAKGQGGGGGDIGSGRWEIGGKKMWEMGKQCGRCTVTQDSMSKRRQTITATRI